MDIGKYNPKEKGYQWKKKLNELEKKIHIHDKKINKEFTVKNLDKRSWLI